MHVSIDEALKRKCPRTALGCVTAQGKAEAAPADLLAEMQACVAEIVKLPEPRGILESPGITATRAAYKALGKDPARYRGSAEALLRRVIAGKGLPQISAAFAVKTRSGTCSLPSRRTKSTAPAQPSVSMKRSHWRCALGAEYPTLRVIQGLMS